MFQNLEDMVFATQDIYTSPTSSIENAYSITSTSQDSCYSTMSEKVPSPDSTNNTPGKPYLKVIEEPANQFRFRYKSEMQGTHGAILGINATKSEKTHPTVKLFNFEGNAIIRCTLYTADNKRRRPHVHRLVGKLSGRAEKDDPHDLRIGPRENYSACFQNLVIIHTAKKVLVNELLAKKKRITEARFTKKLEIDESVLGKMRLEAEQESKGMNMNSVSLKFEAFTLVGQQYIQICEPVYSQPINNLKSHVTGQLRICRISKFYSSCEGGEEIFLFVEKVGKNNIKVLFIELDDDGNEIWRDYATHLDVHHQYGISCRCPKYKSQDISREVCVKMLLERPSDGAQSETRDFKYKPRGYSNTAKRRRLDSTAFSPQIPDSTFEPQIDTFEATASCSSMIPQSSNTDPLLEIEKPYQFEEDYVMLKDTLLSSSIQDEIMNENMNEENASSSISFSAEINKYPTPPETLIQEVYSSEDMQRAIQEEAIAPEHGELVADSSFTRDFKRYARPTYHSSLPTVDDYVGSNSSYSTVEMLRRENLEYLWHFIKQDIKKNIDHALDLGKSTSVKILEKFGVGVAELQAYISRMSGSPIMESDILRCQADVPRFQADYPCSSNEDDPVFVQGPIMSPMSPKKHSQGVRSYIPIQHKSHVEPAQKRSNKENISKRSPKYEDDPVFLQGPIMSPMSPKKHSQGVRSYIPIQHESHVEPAQKRYNKENISKRSPKLLAKDFAQHTLQRLHQIIDTAVYPHVTKADIENKLLMELEIRTTKGDSVLHSAIRHQQFKLVKRLLDCIKSHIDDLSPILNCPNLFSQLTPLHVAVQSNNIHSKDIVEYLLELGADPNKSDIFEFTPLHLAVKENNLRAAKCLLDFPGVNINQVSANMGTALHIASEENRWEMAMLLIQHGADINSIDLQRGQTSLHVAVKKSNVRIVDLLLKQTDIDINKEDYRSQTPLKFAILRADTRLMKIVNKLINHGASYESINMTEETDDSLESIQEDQKQTRSRKMQTLAFLFSQISVAENNDSADDTSEALYHIIE